MAGPIASKRLWQDFDWLLFGAALLLCFTSLIEIYSSTMHEQSENYFLRQLAWVILGVVFVFVIAALDYHVLSEHIPFLYVLALIALVYTLALGRSVAGSKSWVALGPVTIQPSEIIKMVVVVALARYLSELRESAYMTPVQILKASAICLLPMALVALQPDTGTALTYLPILAVGLFIRGLRPTALIGLILAFVLVLPVSWYFLKDYQKDRIRTFLDPGTQVSGKLSFTTPTRIDARLRGEVRATDLLVIAKGGQVHGTVWPTSLVVAGEVRGQILGADRVEIQARGRVTGTIETKVLILVEGGFFEGDCRMTDEAVAALERPARG